MINNNIITNNRNVNPDYKAIIDDLNKRHAVVMLNGKCVVLNEVLDQLYNYNITFSTVNDFKNYYSNQKVMYNGNQEGIGHMWFGSEHRRQYDGVIFKPDEQNMPNYYNFYRGIKFKPVKGDWSLFQNHILEIIAKKDDVIYNYILDWLAHLFQFPGGDRPGIALVLKGKQGTGKGCFATQIGKILIPHFLHISSQHHLTGRFNEHLQDKLLVFVDEGVWTGRNKTAEGVLKAIITEDTHIIEPKGLRAYQVDNYKRLIIASNSDWIIPAGLEERRFLALEVSDKHMQDHIYFEAIHKQMDNGGREAMLFDLINRDISSVNLREAPRTQALLEQIIHSITPVKKFWFECLKDGCLQGGEWKEKIQVGILYHKFINSHTGRYVKVNERQFGKELKELCPKIDRKRETAPPRPWAYHFPDLETCRKDFEGVVKVPVDWSAF